MNAVDLIAKKRDGQVLEGYEVREFIEAYTRDEIPDYQAAAFLMAVFLRGMSRAETVALTQAMAESGQQMDLSSITDYAVDKHSSGGVGDKTTLVVLPLVAALGIPVAKMSGRGLGFSGGTLDKLDAIPGFQVQLSPSRFRQLAQQNGLVLCGQTGELAPADGKLYALRDVTATVASLPLIASSIMSKKLASGAHGIVLDVKWGTGAFMATLEDAQQLAQTMVEIGTDAGRDMIALLSDMNQPLGLAVGNALEVAESIEALQGGGPADLREHCLEIAAHMASLYGRGQRWTDHQATVEELARHLDDGSALAKFRQMVEAQGGNPAVVDAPSIMPQAQIQQTLHASQTGYVARVDAGHVALASLALGAGRMKKTDAVDLAVGVRVLKKVGDPVREGEAIAQVFANSDERCAQAQTHIEQAFAFNTEAVERLPLFYGVIDGRKQRG